MSSIETVTGTLLGSVLETPAARSLFTHIVNRRIAAKESLPKTPGADIQAALDALEAADLISAASSGAKYTVTAKGLKVARDLEKILR